MPCFLRIGHAAKTTAWPSILSSPSSGGYSAAENLHERAFARTVFTHEREHFAAAHMQRHIPQRRPRREIAW
jgi:hypothetical protein